MGHHRRHHEGGIWPDYFLHRLGTWMRARRSGGGPICPYCMDRSCSVTVCRWSEVWGLCDGQCRRSAPSRCSAGPRHAERRRTGGCRPARVGVGAKFEVPRQLQGTITGKSARIFPSGTVFARREGATGHDQADAVWRRYHCPTISVEAPDSPAGRTYSHKLGPVLLPAPRNTSPGERRCVGAGV
jgi:hypothetical protein